MAAENVEVRLEEELRVTDQAERRFLLFALAEVELALELAGLEEIVEPGSITRAPGAPPWVLGALNLRGQAVPVIDLAAKLGLAHPKDDSRRPAILIFRPAGSAARLGAWVSGVLGFVEVGELSLAAPPRFGGAIAAELLSGVLALDERFVPVLDLPLAASAAALEVG